MTCCASATSQEIEIPRGYENKGDKCFNLEEYKDLAVIVTRYEACEEQRALVFSMLDNLEAKSLLLQDAADDLSIALEDLEAEKRAVYLAAEQSADKARVQQQRAKVWRALAATGGAVSVVLGAVIVGLAATR